MEAVTVTHAAPKRQLRTRGAQDSQTEDDAVLARLPEFNRGLQRIDNSVRTQTVATPFRQFVGTAHPLADARGSVLEFSHRLAGGGLLLASMSGGLYGDHYGSSREHPARR